MTSTHEAVLPAVEEGELAELRKLAANGADLNSRNQFGGPLLFDVVQRLMDAGPSATSARHAETISCLIDLGADPNALDDDGGSILVGPIFAQDIAMLELLLRYGVDPNHACGEPYETIYDLAEFDYLYEGWMQPGLPQLGTPTQTDQQDADSYLRFLDQEAERAGALRPAILFLLRKFGALTGREVARRLGGESSSPIIWVDGAWCLEG